jgi:hypothetical protein
MQSDDINNFKIPSDNPFMETVFVHIISDKIFIETEDDSICLSKDQAKKLTYYLHDMLVRPVHDMFGREFDGHE